MISREWSKISASDSSIVTSFTSVRPVKVGALARALGLQVMSATLKSGISGEIRPSSAASSGYKIKVNRHEVKTRQRFTIAHEIAHYLLHRDIIGNGIFDTVLYRSALSGKVEAEANRLAADIVMPAALIREDIRKNNLSISSDSAVFLASLYDVSLQAMKVRIGLGSD
jgi:Zn-dependent peptidase ImmA (M78 family)